MNCPACGHVFELKKYPRCPICGNTDVGDGTDWHVTFSGKQFSSTRPRMEDIDINDICMVLSRFPRYLANTKYMYTVGQHSCYVHDYLVPYGVRCLYDAYIAVAGLTHDGEEAYWCDIPSPYKCLDMFTGYREVASVLSDMISVKFYCDKADFKQVKAADMAVFAAEVQQVAPYHPLLIKRAENFEPAKIKIRRWSERKVRREFMYRFNTAFYRIEVAKDIVPRRKKSFWEKWL